MRALISRPAFAMPLAVVAWLALAAPTFTAPTGASEPIAARVLTEEQPSRVEVTVAAPESPEQLESTIAWARRELESARTENPGLKPEIVVLDRAPESLEPIAGRVAEGGKAEVRRERLRSDEIDAIAKQAASTTDASAFKHWFDRRYHLCFTLVRGLSNAGVVTWGMIVSSDVPVHMALPVGLLAGGISGGFQYHNQKFQAWLLRTRSSLGRFAKYYGINAGFLGVAKLTAWLSGAPIEPGIVAPLGSVFKTAFLGTIAQAPWALAVADHARLEIEKHPQRAGRVRLLNDLKTLAISFVSTGISIADLMGMPLADVALVGMAATGAANYVWARVKWRKREREKASCAGLLLGK